MLSFQKLQVYQKSKENYLLIKEFLNQRSFDPDISERLQNSCLDIILNIAGTESTSEPSGKMDYLEKALARVYECIALFDLLKAKNQIDEFAYLDHFSRLEDVSRNLEKLIKKL